jgi:hypothetical protein
MHGAAVKLPEVFDLRQFIDESGREQKHAPRNPFPVLKDRSKSAIPPLDIHNFHFAKFDRLVAPQLIAADLQKFRGTRAVSGEEPVENARWFIARMPGIAYKHTAQTSTEHERRAQPRRPAADDDRVKNFRVGRAGRLGCDHSGDLKSSATAQDENQHERAYHGNNQGTDAPEAVGEEREHLPLNRRCSRKRFSDGGRAAARWPPITARTP